MFLNVRSAVGILFCLAWLPVHGAHADWTKIRSVEFELAPPPLSGTRAYLNDFQVLHEAQARRSSAECLLAESQRIPSFDAFYGKSARLFSPEELNAARPLMARVFKLAERVSDHFKGKFGRPRPYSTDASIRPCAHKPEGARAYPSSHATLAALAACVLARAYPERAPSIEPYGAYLGNLRFISGVHHPSDVAAGQDLAFQICRRIFSEPDFVREFERVRSR